MRIREEETERVKRKEGEREGVEKKNERRRVREEGGDGPSPEVPFREAKRRHCESRKSSVRRLPGAPGLDPPPTFLRRGGGQAGGKGKRKTE